MLALTGGFDECRQEVGGEGADVDEDAGRLGGAEAEADLLARQVRGSVLRVRGVLRSAARLPGPDPGGLEVIPQPHPLFKKRTHVCRKGERKWQDEESGGDTACNLAGADGELCRGHHGRSGGRADPRRAIRAGKRLSRWILLHQHEHAMCHLKTLIVKLRDVDHTRKKQTKTTSHSVLRLNN